MRKTNRIMMGTVSILLCLVLVTTSVLSGIFAKFVTKRNVEANIAFKKWGITVTPGSDLEDSYSTVIDGENKVTVSSNLSGKLLAPGTRGAFAYLHVNSDAENPPEFPYELDFDGAIDIGLGFWSTETLVKEEERAKEKLKVLLRGQEENSKLTDDELINLVNETYEKILQIKGDIKFIDETGREIEYLPIQFRLRRFDFDSSNALTNSPTTHKLCVERLAPDTPRGVSIFDATDSQIWYFYGQSDQSRFKSLAALEQKVNNTLHDTDEDGLKENGYFNHYYQEKRIRTEDMNGLYINSKYVVEWRWLYHYDTEAEAEEKDSSNRFSSTDNPQFNAKGDYQTAELDTQLGEAIATVNKKYPEYSFLFNIKLDMSVEVSQIGQPYTRNGDIITFGSYPQSEVTDAKLKATLKAAADSNTTWKSHSGKFYVDVKNGKDKYRGVKDTENATTIYWFKFEPINWIVVTEIDGKALLLSEKLLDKRKYQDEYSNVVNNSGGLNTSEGVPSNTVASNWEYSSIRKWLNDTFYKTAFNELQRSIVIETENSNAKSTTSSSDYASDVPTKDKVFFLAYKEFTGTSTGQYGSKLKPFFMEDTFEDNTSYSNQIFNHTYWWTRSPKQQTSVSAIAYYKTSGNTWYAPALGCNVAAGVRPALWINL